MTTPNPESSGPPLRAIAMVLIALAILFAGLGAASLGGSDSSESAPVADTTAASTSTATTTSAAAQAARTTTAAPAVTTTTPTATPTTTSAAVASGPVDKTVPVRVFNNSNVSGLAAQTANELTSNGWNVSETGNYSYGMILTTTVYYGNTAAEKQAAQAIAAELGVPAEPRFTGIASASPGVIVIVTSE
ncbi:LytR family transcriptional regulator [Prescottella agglutinans]|uniref:LytR family transcriptional regulator n=1 Tax=Prescottella agglutinans TaxID=1644129 RepID=A0A3S3EBC1_9NOCA|nr:LytR C-terminal domain-containing protein [Prescottella agglutinans]RVW10058.1 LytR family transcriptional regulator [Prescottella agglutinans]